MEFVSAIVGPVVESLLVPIKKHMGYLISSTSYVGNMGTRMKQLDGIGVDIKKHMEANNISNLEIPPRVPFWLEEVEKIKVDVESISTSDNTCFNVKMRYKAGKRASNVSREIERLIKENSEIIWIDHQKPLGKVNSKKPSTSAPSDGDTQNDFKSRDKTFKEALEFLQPNHNTQMIAICGMGGVGKTTMVDQLMKKAVEDKKMFDWIIKAVIGQETEPVVVQQRIADYMGLAPLTETSKEARADRLRKGFEGMLGEKKKILVLLDDVWWTVDLKDIGLSPLPNRVKLLLTSRNENVCTQMTVEANLIFKIVRVDVLEELEAHNFFCQITGVSEESDPDHYQMGGDIVRRCGFLPLAISVIAATLKSQENCAWRDALQRLMMNDLHEDVSKIIDISYNYLKEEAKAVFLLCGLFPDDSDIPIEELTRYAWGLELLDEVPTLGIARDRTETLVHDLKNRNLLIASDRLGCVKMHDLVLAFVISIVSKGEHAWIINHGDMSKGVTTKMSEPCKGISLTCRGMSEFPGNYKYPNLSLLKLMHGDRSLKFTEDFYGRMEKLQVIAYEDMGCPLLPGSLQCATNLRTLCLHSCSPMDEFSSIGNLMNLEILSFADCSIRRLPSAIGNLKKLRLLDLTGCVDLWIDDGVLGKLVCLEELYMRVARGKAVSFTEANCNELVELSSNLSALEVEFFENKAEPKKVCFKNLKRFRISMGCYLEGHKGKDMYYLEENEGKDMYSFENTLMLVTSKDELLESRINQLFEKTEVLHLKVNGMNDLKDVCVGSLHPFPDSLFYNLRVLNVSECADLRYLFTLAVARGLSELEHLTISSCPILEELVHIEDQRGEMIRFQELKFLSLVELPKLVSLCRNADVTELPQLVELKLDGLPNFTSIYPENKSARSSVSSNISTLQSFLNKEVVIPKLEKLEIGRMEKLKEIWPCQFSGSVEVNICRLKEIKVHGCDNLVNLFPTNPMPWLHHLEFLDVKKCGSIEVIFDMDLGCNHEIEQGSSILRQIEVSELVKLREVWRIKGVNSSHSIIHGFQAVTHIEINRCKSFRNLFIPTTANFDLGAVEYISIDGAEPWRDSDELVKSSTSIHTPGPQCNVISNGGTSGEEVVFEIGSASNTSKALEAMESYQQLPLLPQLKDLKLLYLEWMSHVWKCNWNKFLFPQQQQQQQESSFHNLRYIKLYECGSIKYLFSPLMAKLLPNLEKVNIEKCKGMEEVVSNRDDDEEEEMSISTSSHTNTTFFPHFHDLYLTRLPCLKRIGGNEGGGRSNAIISGVFQFAQVTVASWSLCQYSRKIKIWSCHALSSVIPSHVIGHLQKLEELEIYDCNSMVEVFETQGTGNIGGNSTNVGEGSGVTGTVSSIPRMKNTNLLELPNLKILNITRCDLLRHIFTYSTLESLKQLEKLTIRNCKSMQVIVKEDDGKHTTSSKVVVFPRLKSLKLVDLPNLKGFFLGVNDFRWPLLDKVKINGCPEMMVFTTGRSTAPKLNYIHTSLGKHSLECGLNFHVTTTTLHETRFQSLDSTTSEGMPWSFSNLIDIDVIVNHDLQCIIPSHGLLQLQKLEKINVVCCDIEEVFEAFKGTNSGLNESHSAVKFPKLREVNLDELRSLKYIWKSNQWTVSEFPSLTRVSIFMCSSLEHVFTCSMVGSLLQLQELRISSCKNMEVIVKETEDSETRVKKVVFPCLKSLKLYGLRNLKGFCLGKEDFMWPSLDTLEIRECPEITVFTNGQSTTPELKVIDTSFGLCYAREGPNSFIKTKKQEGFSFGSDTEDETEDD